MRRALIVVDPQYDFMPGGALPVPGGDEIVPAVNRLLAAPWNLVVISQDRHPKNHCSFKKNGGDWPAHCVANTYGAQIHDGILWHSDRGPYTLITKGTEPDQEGYSAFDVDGFNLNKQLRAVSISSVYVCGLATDYCVKATVIDVWKAGHETHLVIDACRAVNVKPGDSERAIAMMVNSGAHVTTVKGVTE